MKISPTIVFLLFIPFFLLAQTNNNDSAYQKPVDKTLQTIGIAVPAIMVTYGAISLGSDNLRKLDVSIRDKLLINNAFWHKNWDDYLQFSPAAVAFGMKLWGVKSTHKTPNMLIIYALGNVLNAGIVQSTKYIVARERPDGSNKYSFPSGHTSTAFVAAEFLHQEYKDQSVWISVGGYTMASLIGVARIYNNKHWLSDVVAGAGIGILSMKLAYWTYPYLCKFFDGKNKTQLSLFPAYHKGTLGLNFYYNF
jgi:membrane-associated phospholipid phosphatase